MSIAAFEPHSFLKVNMSVALIPMAQQYGWSGGERGLVRRAAQLLAGRASVSRKAV